MLLKQHQIRSLHKATKFEMDANNKDFASVAKAAN
jgi:hypothetical protein